MTTTKLVRLYQYLESLRDEASLHIALGTASFELLNRINDAKNEIIAEQAAVIADLLEHEKGRAA